MQKITHIWPIKVYVASQKNILEYLCSEKITHNAINEGCHIDFYKPNVNSLLHSSISPFLGWKTAMFSRHQASLMTSQPHLR
jgi:hypothetical protein